ncbi:MAG: hypothetical protein ACRECX_08360 [Methyloceanibacter sp.]|uniref:hypothetical protein n=1 Tax=Methyloceanibacter sp. TaxID=1965321 RepID=UPI003D6D1E82
MTTKTPNQRNFRITSEDQFDLTQARASYVGMPLWQRLALWSVIAVVLLGIVGDLVF